MTIGPAPMIMIERISVRLGIDSIFGVIPAKAGIHRRTTALADKWAPAFAGATTGSAADTQEPGGHRALPRAHRGDEAVEQVAAVLRAGRGLGVVLHREDRLAGHRQAFERAVEQRDMGGLDAGGQRIGHYREAVVLA